MTTRKFWLIYILLAACQAVICNYCNFTPLVTLALLPVMVVCIPLSISTPWAMVIAFLTGMAVDLISDGVPGLNALALVPVALARSTVLKVFLGHDIVERQQNLSFRAKGFGKISGVCIVSEAIFLLIYTIADGAGMRSFGFNALHFCASLVPSYFLSLAIVALFQQNETI